VSARKENYPGHRIREVWLFIGIDSDGDEGLMAMRGPDGMLMPLVASDEVRRAQLEPIAVDIAAAKNGTFECRHFVVATDDGGEPPG